MHQQSRCGKVWCRNWGEVREQDRPITQWASVWTLHPYMAVPCHQVNVLQCHRGHRSCIIIEIQAHMYMCVPSWNTAFLVAGCLPTVWRCSLQSQSPSWRWQHSTGPEWSSVVTGTHHTSEAQLPHTRYTHHSHPHPYTIVAQIHMPLWPMPLWPRSMHHLTPPLQILGTPSNTKGVCCQKPTNPPTSGGELPGTRVWPQRSHHDLMLSWGTEPSRQCDKLPTTGIKWHLASYDCNDLWLTCTCITWSMRGKYA